MSTTKFDRIAAIGSRQPELYPQPHISPAVIEYRLQQAMARVAVLEEAVKCAERVMREYENTLAALLDYHDGITPDDVFGLDLHDRARSILALGKVQS